ncbi:MAG: RluA family pseudouridine synthase [Clostridia bacterium]|nr:RluA family pseudouridine synthase [Clostridia bacterium]
MDKLEFLTDDEFAGIRADKAISMFEPSLSRNAVQNLLEKELVTVGGRAIQKNYKLKFGDKVEIMLPEPEPTDIRPMNIPLDILYEDPDLLVVNKPKGMVVHPAPGHYDDTLVNALMNHCGDSLSGINGEIRPGIVHRIDKDTGGLLMVAKNDKAHLALAEQIKAHSFKREYRAVLLGNLKEDMGIVDRPIGRHPYDRKKQTVGGVNPRDAVTRWAVLERFNYFCDVKCVLETGRTHQIRVHMLSIGHPVAGDTVYGGEKNDFGLRGQCLFAAVLGFVHPTSGKYMEFEAPLPRWYTDFVERIKRSNW